MSKSGSGGGSWAGVIVLAVVVIGFVILMANQPAFSK